MIELSWRDRVAVLTLDRPEKHNALTVELCHGIRGALDEAAAARVVVITGRGRSFCSGADLDEVYTADFRDALYAMLHAVTDLPKPVVAAVNGAAIGAGTQLAVACDLRVATAQASFGIPAGRLGLAVDEWTVHRLSALAGAGPARAMLLAAEVVKGDEAHRLGLVQRLGDLDAALSWADDVAALAPLTIRAHKAALEGAPDAEAAIGRAWTSDDLQEGLAAFRERRRPVFRAR